jgi:hypothetical protein
MSELYLLQAFALVLFGGAVVVALGVLAHDLWATRRKK